MIICYKCDVNLLTAGNTYGSHVVGCSGAVGTHRCHSVHVLISQSVSSSLAMRLCSVLIVCGRRPYTLVFDQSRLVAIVSCVMTESF